MLELSGEKAIGLCPFVIHLPGFKSWCQPASPSWWWRGPLSWESLWKALGVAGLFGTQRAQWNQSSGGSSSASVLTSHDRVWDPSPFDA